MLQSLYQTYQIARVIHSQCLFLKLPRRMLWFEKCSEAYHLCLLCGRRIITRLTQQLESEIDHCQVRAVLVAGHGFVTIVCELLMIQNSKY